MDTENSPRAAKRLELLARLAELDMAVAESVAAAVQRQPDPAPELVLAYTRISRCLRQTLACEARLEKSPDLPRDSARQSRAARRRPEIRREVERLIDADTTCADRENLLLDLEERLQDPDLLHDIATAPIEDIVLQICGTLGVHVPASEMSDEALDRFLTRQIPGFDPDAPPPDDYPDPTDIPPY